MLAALLALLAPTAVAAPSAAPAAPAVAAAGAGDPARSEVSFASADGTVLHGVVLAPPAPSGTGGPGLVMVGGAGPGTVTDLEDPAAAYARRGVTTLVYDKRTAGYSTTRRDYGKLADDALAAVAALRSRPGVQPSRVGLWGLSEGAWVAALAGSAATVGALGYLLFLAVTAAQFTEPVLLGRPVVWAALQLCAVFAVGASGLAAVGGLRGHRALSSGCRARLGLLLLSSAVFVPWAGYWGLLLP
ncbi:alpha/beta hydrolase family protein [Kitasatospora sp. NPDC004745]|uniref:alpha/beta hydrolase family protein n=1 Tax=Kitasatospora sp. NPDC004745 TaxID=3364019 RepID=UPI0036A75B60